MQFYINCKIEQDYTSDEFYKGEFKGIISLTQNPYYDKYPERMIVDAIEQIVQKAILSPFILTIIEFIEIK